MKMTPTVSFVKTLIICWFIWWNGMFRVSSQCRRSSILCQDVKVLCTATVTGIKEFQRSLIIQLGYPTLLIPKNRLSAHAELMPSLNSQILHLVNSRVHACIFLHETRKKQVSLGAPYKITFLTHFCFIQILPKSTAHTMGKREDGNIKSVAGATLHRGFWENGNAKRLAMRGA